MESRKEKRAKIDVQNLELVELLEKFKTSVVLDMLKLDNNHRNRAMITDRRLINGRFKEGEINSIKAFLSNLLTEHNAMIV